MCGVSCKFLFVSIAWFYVLLCVDRWIFLYGSILAYLNVLLLLFAQSAQSSRTTAGPRKAQAMKVATSATVASGGEYEVQYQQGMQ